MMASRSQASRPGDLKRRVGSVVRTLRKARELSQEALAERAGIGTRHLQKIEAGDSNLTILTLSKLANALTVEPAILLTGGLATPSREPPGGKT